MWRFVSPLCLLLSLLMVVIGFCVLAVDAPEAGLDLHQARAEGNEKYESVLESQLANQQRSRALLIYGLFGGSALLTLVAFLLMRD